MSEVKRMLVSLAHPDDESFGMGGTLAYYAAQGVEITLICATRGEAGEVEPELLEGYENIAELRTAELMCAAEHLGLKEVIFLDYRDSGMAGSPDNDHPDSFVGQPVEVVAERLVGYIRQLRPQVVVTFDPVGGYHHPDHIAIHDATVKAFATAHDGDQYPGEHPPFQPDRLYFHVFPRRFIRAVVNVLKFFRVDVQHFGRNKDIDLAMLAGDRDYPQHVTIKYKGYEEVGQQASNCHASQLDFGSQSSNLFSLFLKLIGGKDHFMQAYPQAADDYHVKDMF